MINQRTPITQSNIQINEEIFESSNIYTNISQEIVITTEDKIRLCLLEYKDVLKAQREWIAPAGIFIALVTTLIATDFKQLLNLSPDVWKALFIFCSIICFLFLLKALRDVLKYRGYRDIEIIIEKLKQSP